MRIKREPWEYRKPKRRKQRAYVHVRRYQFVHGHWVLVEKF